MSYLLTDAVRDFLKTQQGLRQIIRRVPLEGDDNGTVFEVSPTPISIDDPIEIRRGNQTILSSASYTVDGDNGIVTLTNGSQVGPLTMTYTWQEYTTAQLENFVYVGLDILEGAWRRGWAWYTSGSDVILGLNGEPATTPLVTSLAISDSRSEINMLVIAMQIAMLEGRMIDAAGHNFAVRGPMGGLLIDKSKQGQDLNSALTRLSARLAQAVRDGYLNYTTVGGSLPGGFVTTPQSLDYIQNFEWRQPIDRRRFTGSY